MPFKNTFEGGTAGSNLVLASSGGVSGNAFDILVINNVSTPGGGPAVTYSAAAAAAGALGLRMALGVSSTYIRWNDTVVANRYVIRRAVRVPATVSAVTEFMSMRNSTAALAGVRVDSSRQLYICVGASTDFVASKSAVVTADAVYYVELAVTLETGAGGNGVIAFRVLDSNNAEVHTYTLTGQATGTSPATQYRFGGVTTASGWAYDYLDSAAASDLASGWLGSITAALSGTINGSASATVSATSGGEVTFTAAAVGGNGSTVTYGWDWGDGSNTPAASATSVKHTYQTAGTYTVTMTPYQA